MTSEEIIDFWFNQISPAQHWIQDNKFDALIRKQFYQTHQQACAGELAHWRECGEGRLAEIIVLDQFSRNLFRDHATAYAQDAQALTLAQEAISHGVDLKLSPTKRSFLYMPFMHSESLIIHKQAVRLFNQPGLEKNYDFELKHQVIIKKFGRYPHRNTLLGRESSQEEIVFLAQPGSSF